MNPQLRTYLVVLLASFMAVWIGISLAQEEHFIASMSAGLCLWAILSWTRDELTESWLLGFLVFGYVLGNRGFAQLAPIPGLPLFFSELGLGIVLTLGVLRGALRRELPVRRDWLNGLLLLWLVIGAGRLPWDFKANGVNALRDFAMVYYLLYFFAAQALASHAPSRQLLRGALLLIFALLPATGLLSNLFPDFFTTHLLVAGVPLVFYKGDLLATFLFTGFILLLPLGRTDWRADGWRWLAALSALVFGLTLLSRASMVGLIVALLWMGRSGKWRHLGMLIAVCVAGLLTVTVYSLLQKKDFSQTKAYAIYEAVVSIYDYSGTRNYQSTMSSDKGDNNRFRLVWWKNVAEETLTTSPVLGLGFGADLARGFLLEYYPTSEMDFNTRSPHNIFVTTLGRMGLVGVVVLFSIYWVQMRSTAQVAREARADPSRQDAMALQAAVWVLMVSACFGVVLEGPMGAIPFWIMLGLAHHAATRGLNDSPATKP
jgi:O-Antigen ligase